MQARRGAGLRCVARWGNSWFPAALGPEELRRRIDMLQQECYAIGRDPSEIPSAPQLMIGIGQKLAKMHPHNLVGSPEHSAEKSRAPQESACWQRQSFTSNSHEEMLEDMELFAQEVLAHVASMAGAAFILDHDQRILAPCPFSVAASASSPTAEWPPSSRSVAR